MHLQVLDGQLPREQFSLHQLSMVGIPLQFPMAWHGPLLTTGALLTWVSGLLISFLVTCLRGGTLGIDWPASKIATSEQLKKFSWLPHPMHPLPSGPKFQLFAWGKEEKKYIYIVHPENIKLFWKSITVCIPWFNLATNQTLSYRACIDRNFLVEINYIAVTEWACIPGDCCIHYDNIPSRSSCLGICYRKSLFLEDKFIGETFFTSESSTNLCSTRKPQICHRVACH